MAESEGLSDIYNMKWFICGVALLFANQSNAAEEVLFKVGEFPNTANL
jgi:hypothetical protein